MPCRRRDWKSYRAPDWKTRGKPSTLQREEKPNPQTLERGLAPLLPGWQTMALRNLAAKMRIPAAAAASARLPSVPRVSAASGSRATFSSSSKVWSIMDLPSQLLYIVAIECTCELFIYFAKYPILMAINCRSNFTTISIVRKLFSFCLCTRSVLRK
jgi:hypothetical protein